SSPKKAARPIGRAAVLQTGGDSGEPQTMSSGAPGSVPSMVQSASHDDFASSIASTAARSEHFKESIQGKESGGRGSIVIDPDSVFALEGENRQHRRELFSRVRPDRVQTGPATGQRIEI